MINNKSVNLCAQFKRRLSNGFQPEELYIRLIKGMGLNRDI
jgi:hypothetical protein